MLIQNEIDLYVRGQLTGDALEAFEERLMTDSFLAKEVAIQKMLVLGLRQTGLKQNLKSWHQESIKEMEEAQKKRKIRNGLIGGLIAIIVLFAAIWWWKQPKYTVEKAYAVFFEEVKPTLAIMGEHAELNYYEFEKGNYAKAMEYLEPKINDFSTDTEFRMLLGIAYLQNDQFQKAETQFLYVLERDMIRKHQSLEWLALLELKQKNIKKSNLYLTDLLKVLPSTTERYKRIKKWKKTLKWIPK